MCGWKSPVRLVRALGTLWPWHLQPNRDSVITQGKPSLYELLSKLIPWVKALCSIEKEVLAEHWQQKPALVGCALCHLPCPTANGRKVELAIGKENGSHLQVCDPALLLAGGCLVSLECYKSWLCP